MKSGQAASGGGRVFAMAAMAALAASALAVNLLKAVSDTALS